MSIRGLMAAYAQDRSNHDRKERRQAILTAGIVGVVVFTFFLIASLAIGAGPDDDAAAAIALAQAAQKKPKAAIDQKPELIDDQAYAEAYALAAQTGKPLIILVGKYARPMPNVPGAVGLWVNKLNGNADTRILIVKNLTGPSTRLPIDATDDDILLAAFPRKEVSPPATPFAKPSGKPVRGRRATADDDLSGYGPWPKGLEKVEGLKRYAPATMTQQTFNKGIIQAVSIELLEDKYHQSGGMLGLSGWRSDLYKFTPSKVEHRRSWVPVFNGTNDQDEHAFTRSYPDGTIFFDVLSKDGKVFEARKAEKKSGVFRRSVVFRDEAHYPEGYTGLKQTCSSCHDKSGSGGYAVGLAPGGDSVLSDPIPQLEAGYRDPF